MRWAASFSSGTTDAPPLLAARRCDLDADGRADVLGLTQDRKAVFLQGDGTGKFAVRAGVLGSTADVTPSVLAVAAADFNGDGEADLFVWAEGSVSVFHGVGNGNRTVRLSFTGKRE